MADPPQVPPYTVPKPQGAGFPFMGRTAASDRPRPSDRSRGRKDMTPAKYDGRTPWPAFKANYERCARYNAWDEDDCLVHLQHSLEGGPSQILWAEGVGDYSYTQLMAELEKRYGPREHGNQYRAELYARRRRRGETIEQLSLDISRLSAMAFPGPRDSRTEVLAIDAFMRAVDNSELEFHMRQKSEIQTLSEAAQFVQRYEAALMGVETSSADAFETSRSRKPGKVNEAVLGAVGKTATGAAESEMARLQAQVAALTAAMEEMRQAQMRPSSATGPMASGQSSRQGGRSKTATEGPCFNCNEPGHWRNECPHPKKARLPQRKANTTVDDRVAAGQSDDDLSSPAVGEKRAFLRMVLNGRERMCLLDSGCETSVVPPDCTDGVHLRKTRSRLFAANGTKVPLLGEARLRVRLSGLILDGEFLVSRAVSEPMFGIDWMEKHQVTWNFGPGSIAIAGQNFSLVSRPAAETMCRRILVQEDVTVPPKSEQILWGQYSLFGRVSAAESSKTWVLEPCEITRGVFVASAVMPGRIEDLPIYVLNVTDKPVLLRRGCEVADAVLVDNALVEAAPGGGPEIYADRERQPENWPSSRAAGAKQREAMQTCPGAVEDDEVGENLEHLIPLVEAVSSQVTEKDKARLWSLLHEYKGVFSRSEYDLGQTDLVEHEIHTGDARPVKQALR